MAHPGKSKGSLVVGFRHDGKDAGAFAVPAPMPFQTGSEGYFAGGKVTGGDGNEYQASVSLIRVHSKDEAEAPERARIAKLLASQKLADRTAKASKGTKATK